MARKVPLPPSGYSPNKLGKMVDFKSFPNLLGKCPKGDGGLWWPYAIALGAVGRRTLTLSPELSPPKA